MKNSNINVKVNISHLQHKGLIFCAHEYFRGLECWPCVRIYYRNDNMFFLEHEGKRKLSDSILLNVYLKKNTTNQTKFLAHQQRISIVSETVSFANIALKLFVSNFCEIFLLWCGRESQTTRTDMAPCYHWWKTASLKNGGRIWQ